MTVGTERPDGRHIAAGAAALLLVLSVGGCATYMRGGYGYGGPDAPLRARLASTTDVAHGGGSLHYAVSDRAHVALFQVFQDGRVRALYPYRALPASRVSAGAHTVFSSTLAYRSDRGSPFGLGYGFAFGRLSPFGLRATSPFGAGARFGSARMSYVMIVAAREPLRLNRIEDEVPFQYSPFASMASSLQHGTAFSTMDRLLDRLIPPGLPDDDWDVDWRYTPVGSVLPPVRYRRPLWRIAVMDAPDRDASDSTAGDRRPGLLDTGDVPFEPPTVPVDRPGVEVAGAGGTGAEGKPLPPVAVTPDPGTRAPTRPRGGPGDDGPSGDRPDARKPDAAPRPVPGPSEHFMRLFDDSRRGADGWMPADRRDRSTGREWVRAMEAWSRNPEEHDFPDPPRRPSTWTRRAHGWRPAEPGLDRGRLRETGDRRPRRRIDVPRRPVRTPDVRVRSPSRSPSAPRRVGGSSSGSGGGSGGGSGKRHHGGDGV